MALPVVIQIVIFSAKCIKGIVERIGYEPTGKGNTTIAEVLSMESYDKPKGTVGRTFSKSLVMFIFVDFAGKVMLLSC